MNMSYELVYAMNITMNISYELVYAMNITMNKSMKIVPVILRHKYEYER